MLFCVGLRSIPRNTIKHVLVAARDEICNVLDFHTVVFTSMKRGLALVKVWVMKSDCFCWSSLNTSYYHKTRSGGGQGRNMQRLKFTYIFLTLNVLQFHRSTYWFYAYIGCCVCSQTFMQLHETHFGLV